MYSYVLNKPLAVSVSQIAHLSQLNHLTLMIDLFFLKLENNLADKKDENMFINENELIEYSEKITINYENLFCSDYLKTEVRKYIIEKAISFDSKFATDYDKIYIDNWFEFINSNDFEQAEIKEDDKEDNISLYSQSESEDENAVYIETEEEEEESDDEESEEEDESDFHQKNNELGANECQLLKIIATIKEDKADQWFELEEMKEKAKDLGAKNANHIREKEVLFERIKFLEAMNKQDTEIINQLTKKNIESEEEENKKWVKYAIEKEDQIKNLKAVIDNLRNERDEDKAEIKQREEDFHKMYKHKNEEVAKLQIELEEKQQFFKKRTEETLNFYYDLTDKKNEEIKQLKNERDKLKEDYEQMYKDRQHFCNLNSERWDELQKTKKQLDKITEEKKERIGELNDIIWDLKNERDDLKKKLDFKTRESDYFNKRAFDNAKEANTLNNKLDKVKKIIIE